MRSPIFLALASMAVLPTTAHAEGNPAKGASVFARCQVCHSVERGRKSPVGPNLAGVVGRKAGSTEFAYSPAMKAAGFAWSTDKLDAILTHPSAVVKGTKMAYGGLPNPQDRADLIAFLASKK